MEYKEHVKELVQKLDGISYPEWITLSGLMEGYFHRKQRELERELKLSADDDMEEVMRSRFG